MKVLRRKGEEIKKEKRKRKRKRKRKERKSKGILEKIHNQGKEITIPKYIYIWHHKKQKEK